MAINIKNPGVEAAVRKLAAQMGVDLTEAIGCAVNHELARTGRSRNSRLAKMRAIADRVAELPLLDNRTDEEILGYDPEVGPRDH